MLEDYNQLFFKGREKNERKVNGSSVATHWVAVRIRAGWLSSFLSSACSELSKGARNAYSRYNYGNMSLLVVIETI